MWLQHSFITLLVAGLASSAITNRTFDDSHSSFTFAGTWTAVTPNSPCDFCSSKPDPSQTNGGTWHDGNYGAGAQVVTSGSFTFQGSAVYIFGIDQATTQPDITFTLGNIQQVHHYTGTTPFVYNAPFFSATGLAPDQTHTVNWVFSLNPDTDVQIQEALFDYAIVTIGEDDVPSTTTPGALQHKTSENSSNTETLSGRPTSKSVGSSTITSASETDHSTEATNQLTPTSPPNGQSPTTTPSSTKSSSTNTGSAVVTSEPASPRSPSIGAIIGGAIAALCMALTILFIWLRYCRVRRHRRGMYDPTTRSQFLPIEPYPFDAKQIALPIPDTRQIVHIGPASLGRFIFKRQMNNIPQTGPATSTDSPLPPMDGPNTNPIHTRPASHSQTEPPTSTIGPTNGASRSDFRLLEERLATLEAQVAAVHQQNPPPYISAGDD